MKNLKLYLYGTEGCHLCESAEELLCEIINSCNQLSIKKLDIIEDDELFKLYDIRIPVLRIQSSNQIFVLDWPFNKKDIIDLVSHIETGLPTLNFDNKKAS